MEIPAVSVIIPAYIFKIRQNGNSKLGKDEYINYLKLLYSLYSFKLNKIFEK